MGYIYMFGCISPPVYDPLIIKWRMTSKGELPKEAVDQLVFSAPGVVGMYVGKTFDQAKNRPTYVIQSMKNYE
ncbi:MAG: hypothetical protein P8N76_21030 [Pirellulaceae bacterium]|nr:hypothetical protein [Pirellulaceae bacterium]